MKRLLCLILLTFVLPIYGQEKGSQAAANKNTTKNAPPSSVIVVNQEAPDQQENRTKPDPQSYLSRLLSPENLPNIGLLVAGVIGICVAVKTLGAVQRQARIMIEQTKVFAQQAIASEGANKAARESSDALANIERAWIDVRVVRTAGMYLYTVEITNYGRTVAHVNRIVTELRLTDEGGVPPPPTVTTYGKSKLLVPNQPWPVFLINLEGDLGNNIFQKIKEGKTRMDYHVLVYYDSVRPDCRSECLYYWNTAANYGCLVPVEAPEYNQHT